MKKNIFLLLVSTLSILVLMYFYERKESSFDHEVFKTKNTYIEYPYFNKKEIDHYIASYLNSYQMKNNQYSIIDLAKGKLLKTYKVNVPIKDVVITNKVNLFD